MITVYAVTLVHTVTVVYAVTVDTVTVNTIYSVYKELYTHTRDYYKIIGACNTK